MRRAGDVADEPLRIGLNGSALLSPLTGVGQYAKNLAEALVASGEVELHIFYLTAWSREIRTEPIRNITKIKELIKRVVPHPYLVSRFLQQLKFTQGARHRGIQLYHEPNFLPCRYSGPTVLTVHDLSYIRYPETHPAERVKLMQQILPRALQHTAHVIVPTEFVKQELIDIFALPASRITATQEAARSVFWPRSIEERRATLERHRLQDRGFFLCVGTLEPRKNVEAALQAHALLPSQIREKVPLAVVGMRGWLTSRLEGLMAGPTKRGEVMPLGFISDSELADIYSACTALIYPSIYEGFGLPVLEAMACGVPVITSNVSSLPEVAGDAAITLHPADIEGMQTAMMRLIEDSAYWNDRASASLLQAGKFSWARCASETQSVYKRALSGI